MPNQQILKISQIDIFYNNCYYSIEVLAAYLKMLLCKGACFDMLLYYPFTCGVVTTPKHVTKKMRAYFTTRHLNAHSRCKRSIYQRSILNM